MMREMIKKIPMAVKQKEQFIVPRTDYKLKKVHNMKEGKAYTHADSRFWW